MSDLKELIMRSTRTNMEVYGESCRTYGSRGWAASMYDSEETQMMQFLGITKMMPLNGKTVLDVGCGQGDFLTYMQKNNITPNQYVGIDICPDMINVARQKHVTADFRVTNLMEMPIDQQFDSVVCCSAFDLSLGTPLDQHSYVKECLKKLHALSKIACCVTFLTSVGDQETEAGIHRYDPGKVFDYCLTLSPKAALAHTMKTVFTILLLR